MERDPIDTEKVRLTHSPSDLFLGRCRWCNDRWPCLTVCCCDEIDLLRAALSDVPAPTIEYEQHGSTWFEGRLVAAYVKREPAPQADRVEQARRMVAWADAVGGTVLRAEAVLAELDDE